MGPFVKAVNFVARGFLVTGADSRFVRAAFAGICNQAPSSHNGRGFQ
jgi:hypothetical protein